MIYLTLVARLRLLHWVLLLPYQDKYYDNTWYLVPRNWYMVVQSWKANDVRCTVILSSGGVVPG